MIVARHAGSWPDPSRDTSTNRFEVMHIPPSGEIGPITRRKAQGIRNIAEIMNFQPRIFAAIALIGAGIGLRRTASDTFGDM